MMRVLGLDPGLRRTGWGVVESTGNRLRHLASGAIATDAKTSTAARLTQLFEGVLKVIDAHLPTCAAVEEVFVNKNPGSTLKLGQARGVVMLAPALRGLAVGEYATNMIKKSVVGVGHAQKEQVAGMLRVLLPGAAHDDPDAADALAVAICHIHHTGTRALWLAEPQSAPRP